MESLYFGLTDIVFRNIRLDCSYQKCKATCCRGPWARSIGVLKPLDVTRLRAALGSDYGEYVKGKRLRMNDDRCIFLDPKTLKCRVYRYRPLICRTYPFHFEKDASKFFRDYYHSKHFPDLEQRIAQIRSLFRREIEENLPGGAEYYFVFYCPDCPRVFDKDALGYKSSPALSEQELRSSWFKYAIELLKGRPATVDTIQELNRYLWKVNYHFLSIDVVTLSMVANSQARQPSD